MSKVLEAVGLKKKVDPLVQAKEWQRKIKREIRTSEREIKELEREEQKFIKECQKTAKLGARAGTAVKTIAKNVVMARKAKERACMTRAQLNSVAMTLTQQVSMIKVAKCMQKSTDVMHAMNDAIKLPHLNAQMMEMAKEMERAGLIEELIGDALGDAFGGEELEEEADAEVSKVLEELTLGMFDNTGAVANTALPSKQPEVGVEEQNDEEQEELDDMKARLQAL
ncbi:hypothetical protein TrST_g3494 [Triparma strigata]|uniref:Charged multivesicular body protein 3 n=1 Tax=Triparma strigata TaxID=1606541 RepID=A0A9W7BKZ9_9STRA|nr:hypothetical protein TrST_g3494 [Triparma strigata]|eukprot:CAMPEP_0182490858 /NCGR_PEP_ID=MMETSP1321-20130603/564_1 /TAXON_ID=91990 /ORGANISM="Bolidomonas sp., Strain RCC1657" /LENGTH=224 /DNA_ID=CAMNT_0024693099 /DNA_START=33 /DNA_END=707 /DNA_ORIENTATION=+